MNNAHLSRRDLLRASGSVGLAAALPLSLAAAQLASVEKTSAAERSTRNLGLTPLQPPSSGAVRAAFALSEGAVVIDFAGPWEVFLNATVPGRDMMNAAFDPYVVAEKADPITVGGGMKIVPNYTIENAPQPNLIVIPAQRSAPNAMLEWIRTASKAADLTMSVCTGAFVLAATGLLDGKSATTHHNAYPNFMMNFPKVKLVRGARFVEEGNLATSGGLTSGMDLALRVVGRYFGADAIDQTTLGLEYQGQGWTDAKSNSEFAVKPSGDICPVCWMKVDPKSAPSSVYHGHTYYFCLPGHKGAFDAKPDGYIEVLAKS